MADIEELVKYQRSQCNRYVNGQCSSRACLVRGGWKIGSPDYSTATCIPHEAATALSAQQREIAELRAEREEAYAAMRWVYENGMRPDYDRPQRVSAAFNDAFASVRAALNKQESLG